MLVYILLVLLGLLIVYIVVTFFIILEGYLWKKRFKKYRFTSRALDTLNKYKYLDTLLIKLYDIHMADNAKYSTFYRYNNNLGDLEAVLRSLGYTRTANDIYRMRNGIYVRNINVIGGKII